MSLDYLEQVNSHERDKHVILIEQSHKYIVKNRIFTSTTTFIHSLFKPFDSTAIINNMMNSPNWKDSIYYGKSKQEIKNLWKQNGKEAASAGTLMHEDIEKFYNNMQVNNNSIEYSYFLDFQKSHKHLIPYRTEWKIYDEELQLSGCIDIVYIDKDTDELILGDWKRCKEIKKINTWKKYSINDLISHIPDTNFFHYSLQLNVYKRILEKNYNKKVKEMFLVCLHPENFNNSYLKYKVKDMTKEVNALFNQRKEIINNK